MLCLQYNTIRMNRIDFVDEFISVLQRSIPKRPELVRELARILRIEVEPASRRLSRQVNFSVNEVLTLARELNISLDSLVNEKEGVLFLPSVLDLPWQQKSMDSLASMIEMHYKIFRKICTEPFTCIALYTSLPMEFFAYYPEIFKFHLFKWGHFFIDPEEYNNYDSWTVPPQFEPIREQSKMMHVGSTHTVYIWDDSLIFSLVREVGHLCATGVIDPISKMRIRTELHTLLYDMERSFKNPHEDPMYRFGHDFYIASIQIGANAFYMSSQNYQSAFFSTHFTHTKMFEDKEYCQIMGDWINSLKKVSTLISGSGYKERSLFFKDQHEVIDWQLRK